MREEKNSEMPGELYEAAEQFRQRLLRREEQVARQLVDAYAVGYRNALAQFQALNEQIRTALAAGETVTDEMLLSNQRYRLLIGNTENFLRQYSEFAALTVEQAQAQAVRQAIDDSEQLLRRALEEGVRSRAGSQAVAEVIRDVLPDFSRVPADALQFLVGSTQEGAPLRDYFLRGSGPTAPPLSREVVDRIRQGLFDALLQGWNPERTAQTFRQAWGVGLTRALRIARTEQLRSYREASRAVYSANGVQRWRWMATLDERTCAACLALDGREFSINQPQQAHVNCRCTMVPVLPNMPAELRRRARAEDGRSYETFQGTGQEWFDRLPENRKIHIVGAAKYRALQAGEITLSDLVATRERPPFGEQYVEASLVSVLGERAFEYYER